MPVHEKVVLPVVLCFVILRMRESFCIELRFASVLRRVSMCCNKACLVSSQGMFLGSDDGSVAEAQFFLRDL